MNCAIKVLLITAAVWTGGSAIACKPVMMKRLTFPEGSAELETVQVAALAELIDRANSAFPKYLGVSIDGGATVKVPGRPPAVAAQLARRRAEIVTQAYKQLERTEINVETTSNIYEDNKMSRGANNDFVVVQFHLDYETLNLPDCNPTPVPGFKPSR